MAKALISCDNITLGYENQAVMEGFSLDVCQGDYLCIVGENGSGKSTLVKALLGLLAPMAGVLEQDESLKHGAIGYLPQQTAAQKNFPATVMEVVLSGFLSGGRVRFFYTRAQKSAVLQQLGKLGILELKDACYRNLSGGQQQRVLLARALCAAEELLVLDEPITGLDPAAAQEFYKTMGYLNQTEGKTIIMVTHDLTPALHHAKTVLHLGRKQWFYGTVAEYIASPVGKRFEGGL